MACEQEHQRRSSQRNYDSLSPLAVLPNETLVNILFYALDETKTFDILVEADDYEAYKGFPLEGIDGEIIFWRVRKETCLSTVCRLWKELFEKKYVSLTGIPSFEIRLTATQWFHPSLPKDLFSLYARSPYSRLKIYFSNFTTPPPSEEPVYTPLLAMSDRKKLEISPNTTDIHLIMSHESSVSLDAVLGPYDLPPRFRITFTVNSCSRIFLSSFNSVYMSPQIDLVFELNSWRYNEGGQVPETIAAIVKWFWSAGGGSRARLVVRLPEDGHEFFELTKTWRGGATPTFLRDWHFEEVSLERFAGGGMVSDFLACAGIRLFVGLLILVIYPMEVCHFYHCRYLHRPDKSHFGYPIPASTIALLGSECTAAQPLMDSESPPSSSPSSSTATSASLSKKKIPRQSLEAGNRLPPSPPLDDTDACITARRGANSLLSSHSFTSCENCHRYQSREPFDFGFLLYHHQPTRPLQNEDYHTPAPEDDDYKRIHRQPFNKVRELGLLLCEGERLLPEEGEQLNRLEKKKVNVWAAMERDG